MEIIIKLIQCLDFMYNELIQVYFLMHFYHVCFHSVMCPACHTVCDHYQQNYKLTTAGQ